MLEQPINQNHTLYEVLKVLTMIVIIIAGLRSASDIISPILMAVFLAILSSSFLNFFINKGLSKILSWAIVVIFVLSFITSLSFLVSSSANEFSEKIPSYIDKLDLMIDKEAKIFHLDSINNMDALKDTYNPSNLIVKSMSAINHLGQILSDSFVIFLMMIFMLMRRVAFNSKIKYITRKENGYQSFSKVIKNIDQYILILGIFSFLTGLSVYVVLKLLDIDFALMWALAAFFLNFIPNIGSVIAAIPPVFIALIEHGPAEAGLVALAYLSINTLYGNILMPKFLGKGLDLSIVVIFMSLIFWGWVFGPIGMFLSVPLTVMIKIVLEENEQTRWIAILLGDETYERYTNEE